MASIHPHSLIEASHHSTALMELLEANPKYTRNFIGVFPKFVLGRTSF